MEVNRLIDFIETTLIERARALLADGHVQAFFVHAAVSIEFLGAFLDKKPLRARQQSKERFQRSLEVFFPPSYAYLNQKGLLYDQFRNHVVHSFLPSSRLRLVHDPSLASMHLKRQEGKLILEAGKLLVHLETAAKQLQLGLQKERYPVKWMEGL